MACPLRFARVTPSFAAMVDSKDIEVIRDPLWDNIRLDRPALLALDTAAVQRLRYVRQVGHAFLVYPGATHTRFEHALGAYHLTRRALASLEERGELDIVPDDDCLAVRLAALLHDIGHYPFSHALEEAGFPSHETLGRGQAVPGRARRASRGDRRPRVRRSARRAHHRRERQRTAGADLRVARPGQDRLPEPRRPHVRRPVRDGGRGPPARHPHAGRDRAGPVRGGRAGEGRERAGIAALRQVPDVPERLLAPRGAVGDLHVQAGSAGCGRARERHRGRHRRGHRRRADGAAHHAGRQRARRGHPRPAAAQARARPAGERRARGSGALGQRGRRPARAGRGRARRARSGSRRATCCSTSPPGRRCSAWTFRSGPGAAPSSA